MSYLETEWLKDKFFFSVLIQFLRKDSFESLSINNHTTNIRGTVQKPKDIRNFHGQFFLFEDSYNFLMDNFQARFNHSLFSHLKVLEVQFFICT
jgi:hypothetical protein